MSGCFVADAQKKAASPKDSDSSLESDDSILSGATVGTTSVNALALLLPTSRLSSTSAILALSGSCQTGSMITLSGDDSQTTPCLSSQFIFNVEKSTDGVYHFEISQPDPSGGSPQTIAHEWKRDTTIPDAPTISAPSVTPHFLVASSLTLSGSCTTGLLVNLTGSDAQSTPCVASAYSFLVAKSTDDTYNFNVAQSNLAGTSSSSVSLQWVRDSTPPAAPTVTSPGLSPSYSSTSLNLAGGCVSGYTVYLSGDSTQTGHCAASNYSFVVNQSVDGSYAFSILQKKPNGMPSSSISHQWIRDAHAPSVNITSHPPTINTVTSASLGFASVENLGFLCRLDGGIFSSCTSPVTYTGLSNGAHSVQVKSENDLAGNPDLDPKTYTWSQQIFDTVALYHFDSTPGASVDTSSYTGTANNLLATDSRTSAGASSKWGQSRTFTANSSSHMDAPDNVTHSLLAQTLSVEGWVKFSRLPDQSSPMILASKMGASGQYGWAVGIIRSGTNYQLTFDSSLDGTTLQTRQTSSTFSSPGKSNFHHYAVTWDQGTVSYYYDGDDEGSDTLGTALSLFTPSTPLTLGAGSTGVNLDGILDEVRISKTLRWTGAFTVPTSAYTAD